MIQNITGKDLRRIQNVFLDLDGTITESGPGCMNGVKYMFDKIGHQEDDERKIRAFVGPTVKKHLQDAYGFSETQAADAYVHYREYYDSKGIYESCPYEGIEDAIQGMIDAGKKVYVGTLKPEDQAYQILDRFGLRNLFSGVFGARHDLGIYHKEDVLERAIDILGHTPPNSAMVGDRLHDVLAGQHVGFDTVGVLYGYGHYAELTDAGCDVIVDSVKDLVTLLGGYNK